MNAPGVLDAYPPDGQAAYTRYLTTSDAEMRAEFRAFCQNVLKQFLDGGQLQGMRITKALDAVLAHDAAGPAREARLQSLDWGFGPSDVVCPVDLWHFKGDTMVPFEAARRSAENLAQVSLHIIEWDGHIVNEAVLRQMTGVLSQV